MSAQPLNTYNVTDYTSSKGGEVVGASMDGGKVAEYVFSYDDLPAPVDSTGTRQLIIPANSGIRGVELKVSEAFTGATSLSAGLQQADGTEIDNDGLIAAETTLTAGSYSVGAGALVGASTGAADGQVVVTLAGTATAGVATITVDYL